MKELQDLLARCDIVFDHRNNCIMCYLHIINIYTCHIVAASTKVGKKYVVSNGLGGDEDDDFDPSPHQGGPQLNEQFILLEHWAWLKALQGDPIKHVIDFVHYIHASYHRMDSFEAIVKLFTKKGDTPLVLMEHVKTCWDSIYLMLQHFRLLRKVSACVQTSNECWH